MAIDKQELSKGSTYLEEANFYKYAASLVIELATPYLNKAVILIDGNFLESLLRNVV